MESKSREQLLRDEFEAWLAPSWSRDTYRDDDGDVEYLDDWVQGAWMGWIASRAALVVELPDEMTAREALELGFMCDYAAGVTSTVVQMRDKLQSAGITVK